MDLRFTPEQEAWRQEVRDFLAHELPAKYEFATDYEERDEYWDFSIQFTKKVGAKGWLGLTWPKEYGGLARSSTDRAIMMEEFDYRLAPLANVLGHNLAGGTLLKFCTEEQKRRLLPPILKTETIWLEGLTEPNAGFKGGKVDAFIMRCTDVMLAMPIILVALTLAAALRPSLFNVTLVISLGIWAGYARMVRGEVLSIKERDFVALARVAGAGSARIIVHHILPNVFNTIIILATLNVGTVILFEAALSFLGLGVPADTPTWGAMVNDGRKYLSVAWWVTTIPGIAIMFTVLGANLMGDWLRDALDPKRRQV